MDSRSPDTSLVHAFSRKECRAGYSVLTRRRLSKTSLACSLLNSKSLDWISEKNKLANESGFLSPCSNKDEISISLKVKNTKFPLPPEIWLPTPLTLISKEDITRLNRVIEKRIWVESGSSRLRTDDDDEYGQLGNQRPRPDPVIHACSLLGGKTALMFSKELRIISRQVDGVRNSDVLESVAIESIRRVLTDPEMEVVDLILENVGENPPSIRIIPGETEKTEQFINYLLITANQVANHSKELRKQNYVWPRFLEVSILSSILSLPSSIHMKNYFCKASTERVSLLYFGLALISALQGGVEYRQEFMLQKGNQHFQPVQVSLQNAVMEIVGSGENPDAERQFSISFKDVSALRRTEVPRPYSCSIIWNSITIYLAASNRSIANEWFELLCYAKRISQFTEIQPAHVIATDVSIYLFSSDSPNLLLFRTPLINISKSIGQNGIDRQELKTVIFETETVEADEAILIENAQWRLEFLKTSGARRLLEWRRLETSKTETE